jgi:prephenate dehydratase
MKISYLGPEGTYCYGACNLYVKNKNYEMIKSGTITNAITLLLNDEVDECIVPIENSIKGTVLETLDVILENRELNIIQEVILDIRPLFIN